LRKALPVILFILGFFQAEARADIIGPWNEYSSITQVFNADSSDLDSVRVSNPIFGIGDTVMFIQMKGMEVNLILPSVMSTVN